MAPCTYQQYQKMK